MSSYDPVTYKGKGFEPILTTRKVLPLSTITSFVTTNPESTFFLAKWAPTNGGTSFQAPTLGISDLIPKQGLKLFTKKTLSNYYLHNIWAISVFPYDALFWYITLTSCFIFFKWFCIFSRFSINLTSSTNKPFQSIPPLAQSVVKSFAVQKAPIAMETS